MRVHVAAILGMIEVRLHYDQIAGAIEILQVPLHQTFLSLQPYFSNFRRKERPIRTINNTYLVPTCYYPHQRKLISDYITLHLTAHSLVLGLQLR